MALYRKEEGLVYRGIMYRKVRRKSAVEFIHDMWIAVGQLCSSYSQYYMQEVGSESLINRYSV